MRGNLAIAAVAIAIATLAGGAAAQTQRTPLDVKACLRDARTLIDRLQPAAAAVLGKPLDIVSPTMVDIFTSARSHGDNSGDGIKYAARVDGSEVRVAAGFCRANAGFRLAIVAHELGHLVDNAAGTAPDRGRPDWSTDPREIAATRRAAEILRAAGIGPQDLLAALPTEHLESAGILRTAPLPPIAQAIAGSRKVSLFHFDGKPGQWAFGRGDPIELTYAPTEAVVDEFFLVYFIILRGRDAHDARDAKRPVPAEAAALAYRRAGGDLAAVVAAMEDLDRRRVVAANPGFTNAIRRVLAMAPDERSSARP